MFDSLYSWETGRKHIATKLLVAIFFLFVSLENNETGFLFWMQTYGIIILFFPFVFQIFSQKTVAIPSSVYLSVVGLNFA